MTPENINVDLPSGLKIDEIQPSKIAVRLEKIEEREISVKPEIEGSVAEGFEIYSQTVLPPRVRVRGPESFVKSLDSISTEKITLDNRKEDFTVRQVGLNVVNPKITLLDTIVDVAFRIGEKRSERLFVVPYKTETESKRASVLLFGARSLLEKLSPELISVAISQNENGESVPQIILPDDVKNKVEIKSVKLH